MSYLPLKSFTLTLLAENTVYYSAAIQHASFQKVNHNEDQNLNGFFAIKILSLRKRFWGIDNSLQCSDLIRSNCKFSEGKSWWRLKKTNNICTLQYTQYPTDAANNKSRLHRLYRFIRCRYRRTYYSL